MRRDLSTVIRTQTSCTSRPTCAMTTFCPKYVHPFLTCRRIRSSVVPPSATARAAGSRNGDSQSRPDHRCQPNRQDASMAEQEVLPHPAQFRAGSCSPLPWRFPSPQQRQGVPPRRRFPRLLALLERYRDTCIRLRGPKPTKPRKLLSIPASLRPGSSDGKVVSRWPNGRGRNWTRSGCRPACRRARLRTTSSGSSTGLQSRTPKCEEARQRRGAKGQDGCVGRPAGHSKGLVRQDRPDKAAIYAKRARPPGGSPNRRRAR